FRGDDQRRAGPRAGRGDRLPRARQAGRPGDLERPDLPPDPVLAGGGPRPDGGEAGPGGARSGLTSPPRADFRAADPGTGQTLPRASSSTVVVSIGSCDIVTASFGWTAGSPPISWRNFARASRVAGASSSSGIGTTIRGSSWAMSSAAFCGDSEPPT